MNAKEQYELNLQDLMGSVPTSAVAKQLDVIIDEDNDKIIDRQIRWVTSDHVVYSGLRTVYSIEAEDLEVFKFILKSADYKKFVSACKARRKELYGTKQRKK
jgi:chaperone required for assembly of F1-ATPase